MGHSKKITIFSYAKLNLFLKVLGGRADGYHNIYSIFQSVDYTDELTFSLEKGRSGISIRSLHPDMPYGDDNLITMAYAALAKERDIPDDWGIICAVKKNIPIGSGMAGGSSNCAATLVALNILLELDLQQKELIAIGEKLGSDIPFFFTGGTCFVYGRGEKFEITAPITEGAFLIVTPPVQVKSSDAYAMIDTYRLERGITVDLDTSINEMREFFSRAILEKNFETYMHNDFEDPIFEKFPEIKAIKNKLDRICNVTLMTGSGSAIFAYFRDFDKAWETLGKYEPMEGETVSIARPVSEGYFIYV